MASTTTPGSLFSLPSEILTTLIESFPCREPQIRTLATLVHPRAAPVRNLIIHGVEATGKSAITSRLLSAFHHHGSSAALDYAIVRSAECVTARHLFERTVSAAAHAAEWDGAPAGRCETLSALTVELGKILERYGDSGHRRRGRQGEGDGTGAGVREEENEKRRFVLVFDGIDRQREAPPTLLPALARLSEIIPNLTTIFILTSPSSSSKSLRLPASSGIPTLHFPPYTKPQYLTIVSSSSSSSRDFGPPSPQKPLPNATAQETADLWARFAAAVHDALIKTAGPRTLPALAGACRALWPRFTAPVAAGTYRAREFGRLLVAARVLFQDESALQPGIGGLASSRHSKPTTTTTATPGTPSSKHGGSGSGAITGNRGPMNAGADLAALLPLTPRLLLIAAYLASHNAPRHDQTLFSTWHHQRRRGRRRRGPRGAGGGAGGAGGSGGPGAGTASNRAGTRHQHRRIARKLLGPGAFVLERMVAIYAATRREWCVDDGDRDRDSPDSDETTVDGDVAMAIATLASLRLLVRVGGGGTSGAGAGGVWGVGGGADLDRGGKWRVNVSWEIIRALGRSMGVEVEEWLIE